MRKSLFMIAAMTIFLSSCGASCPKTAPKKEIGIQLYSLRGQIGSPELYAENHVEVLKTLAELGYTAVEAANYNDGLFYGVSPEQFSEDLAQAGLQPLSSHVGRQLSAEELASGDFSASLAWWKDCISAHKAAGIGYVVMPWMGVPASVKDLQTQCEYLNSIGRLCRENGVSFGYHNHSHEFAKVEGKEVMFDYMLSHTDPESVFFQMDVYWTVIGKASPVEYFKKYPGRFKMLHIKDYREIGQSGMVGFDAIFNNSAIAGMNHFIVELEAFSTEDWKECIGMCSKYLTESPFVKASYAEQGK